jgi:stress response protein YsnF
MRGDEEAGAGRKPSGLKNDGAMTRSEEELAGVRREWRPRERVRVRRRVVTEIRSVEVELRREELVVEREPVGDDARPAAAPAPEPTGTRASGSGEFTAGLPPGVERRPVELGDPAGHRPSGSAAEPIVLVLHAEEPVVTTRVVPLERVRVVKELITDQRPVTIDLRRERIEVERTPAPPPDDAA